MDLIRKIDEVVHRYGSSRISDAALTAEVLRLGLTERGLRPLEVDARSVLFAVPQTDWSLEAPKVSYGLGAQNRLVEGRLQDLARARDYTLHPIQAESSGGISRFVLWNNGLVAEIHPNWLKLYRHGLPSEPELAEQLLDGIVSAAYSG